MNTCSKLVLVLLATVLGFEGGSPAAPSLPVTKIPVTPALSYTGPTNDSHAIMGQWFKSATNSDVSYRTHEFYDNTAAGGGGSAGSLAIEGRVTNVTYATKGFPLPVQVITAFDVIAILRNDAATIPSGPWAAGTNAFGETLTTANAVSNALLAAIMTADFATTDILPIGNIDNFPYRNAYPYITSTNHDVSAWYGWNSEMTQDGDYYVPGWCFGALLPGQSATQLLHFVIRDAGGGEAAIPPSDARYSVLAESETQGNDIFINRSTSLKIKRWIGDPGTDSGTNYPVDLEGVDASNVSVFHNTIDDDTQSVAICQLRASTNGTDLLLESTGSVGIRDQILQTCTDLRSTNWVSVLTNQAWPIPQTNQWTCSGDSEPVRFYRIIQP